MPAADPTSTDAVLRASVTHDGAIVTLDRRFEGLPDTAHGGTVLALFDTLCATGGARGIAAVYHRRVPLEQPLQLTRTGTGDTTRLVLSDGATPLVTGTPVAAAAPARIAPPRAGGALALPVSRNCFACGTDNSLGLRARLAIDEHAIGGVWEPPPSLRAGDGTLATVALTGLLDEVAFWLGAAASGEAGMTTDLRVTLPATVAFGRLSVTGARDAVRAQQADSRYWDVR